MLCVVLKAEARDNIMNISLTSKGSFEKAISYLQRLRDLKIDSILNSAGQKGVDALIAATPRDSGILATSWSYTISKNGSGAKIEWHNADLEGGYNVALLVQYGHGTGTGGYVPPRDYINPAIDQVFQELSRQIGEEVKRV